MAGFNTWQPHFPDISHRASSWRDWFDGWCATWGYWLYQLPISYDCLPQPQKPPRRAFQLSTQGNTMYHWENIWTTEKKIPCATLWSEWQGMHYCCCLRNIAVNLREPDSEDCDMEDDGCAADLQSQYHGLETGNAVRQHITNTFF